jgi:long-chain acyl-CoA synthetase
MRHGGARIFVAEDQEYVDRILPLIDRLPDLEWIVVIDTAAMFAYDHPKLKSWKELMERSAAPADPAAELERLAAAVDPRDPAFIVYTSGTTGYPKGALVSHGRHLARCEASPITIRCSRATVTGPWSICRFATCWAAMSPSRCR